MVWFLQKLYGSFAWGYDLIANIVSLGDWKLWTIQINKFLSQEEKILEVGLGTGILQNYLVTENFQIFGCDLSKQMLKISSHRLKGLESKILRANNKELPFSESSFSKIIATFPSDYIFSADFLKESQRLLKVGGELIVLLSVNFVKNDLISRFYRILYKITGQSKSKLETERIINDVFGPNLVVKIFWDPYKNVELCFVTLKRE